MSAMRVILLPMLVLALAGCATAEPAAAPATSSPPPPAVATATPTPSPTPTVPPGPPALGDLVLHPDGLGSLRLGEPMDPLLVTWDAEGCKTPENEDYLPADDPAWGAWLPNYPKLDEESGGVVAERYPFEPHHTDAGELRWLNVRSEEVATAEGIGLGSTEDELLAAYPEATLTQDHGYSVYDIAGAVGRLVFEVPGPESDGNPEDYGLVGALRVAPLDWPVGAIRGDAGGWCAIGV